MRKPITQEEWDAYVASVLADDYRMPAWEIAGEEPRLVSSHTLSPSREDIRALRMKWRRERIRTGITVRENNEQTSFGKKICLKP